MDSFDCDLFVIGGGSGGVRAARIAASHGARVVLAEEDKVGGTCVVRGCVPKKLLFNAAHVAEVLQDSIGFGWAIPDIAFDWPTLSRNVATETERLVGIYTANLEKAGVTIVRERAVIAGAHRLRLAGGREISARYILIATGARPRLHPELPGLENAITSNEVFDLKRLPKRLLIVGGGYIAVEFAGIFNNLGCDVTLIYRGREVLRGFDADVRRMVHGGMQDKGIVVHTDDTLVAIEGGPDSLVGVSDHGERIPADEVLIAIGREPNTSSLGLELVGVQRDGAGSIEVNRFSQSTAAGIYAIGDVATPAQLTPLAIRQGEAVAETLFGGKPTVVDYNFVPTAVFGTPEVGAVGLTEEEAIGRHPAVDIYRSEFRPLANRMAGRDEKMLMKVVVNSRSGQVLGCHVVGPGAAEMAQLLAIPLKMRATKADFDAVVALHPTAAEEIVTMRSPAVRHRTAAVETG